MDSQYRTNSLHSSLACPCCGAQRTATRFVFSGGVLLHRCRDCTVEFCWPQPDEAQLKELYSEGYYAAWGISGQQDNESTRSMKRGTFRLRLALIRRFLQPPGSAHVADPSFATGTLPRILDIGCATGYFLELAAEQGFQPFGIELSGYAAARARLRIGAAAIVQGTQEQSTFPTGWFTAVVMADLLEHVRLPLTTLTHAETLLRSDGVILIMTPDTGSLSRRLMGARWTHYKPEHLFYFNRRSLNRLARRCGLEVVHFQRSKKALNLAYLHTQFRVYRHPLLTPLATLAYRLAPQRLRTRNFYLSIGELTAILKKKP
jgi:2-polyprenyl-3-methyl-5-hydroxy-6-metoxy-1,4-benzoquinol methylase